MSVLSTSGHKKSESSITLDLSPEVQQTGGEEGAAEVVTTGTQEAKKDLQPVDTGIQDTSQEIQQTGEFDKPLETGTETKTQEEINAEAKAAADIANKASQDAAKKLAEESASNAEIVEVTEEQLLKSLSEKLGREVASFDDLTKTEDPFEKDPYLKELAAWREKTNRPIEDWVKFQKDYSKVSDTDIAREYLQLQYPELTSEDIDLELSHKYISSEDDMDSDAALKNLELKKLVARGRKELGDLVSNLGSPDNTTLSPEVKQNLEYATKAREYQAQVKEDNLAYDKAIVASAADVKSLSMELAEGVTLDYKLPEGSEKNLIEMVKNAPHWKNEDGTYNHQAVVRDAAIIANLPEMLKLAFQQGANSGTDETIRGAKNSTLGNRSQSSAAAPTQGRGIEIEGLDKFLGGRGMKIRKRN